METNPDLPNHMGIAIQLSGMKLNAVLRDAVHSAINAIPRREIYLDLNRARKRK